MFHPTSRSFLREGLVLAGAAVALLAPARPARATPIEWALHDRACSVGASTLEVPCGNYGTFHFLDIQVPSGCTPVAAGSEEPPAYVQPGNLQVFPVPPHLLFHGGVQFHPAGTDGATGAPQVAATLAGGRPPAAASASASASGVSTGQPPAGDGPWIGVIDFDGPHGASTTWLADAVAGPDVTAWLSILDDPALSALGPVGDFHVLSKLCEIAEDVDFGGADPPLVVNMSFGRSPASGDDSAPVICDAERGSCQIARVIQYLREKGTRFVAAAGNQQEMLFPAVLPNVLAAGMLDVNSFFQGVTQRAWETPPTAAALLPGNGLCLDDWAAPAGSSYSSAMMAGWLSAVIDRFPHVDVTAGPWTPAWNPTLGCYVLSTGLRQAQWCNATIETLFDGLLGANENACWMIASTPSVELAGPGSPQGQPAIPGFSTWAGQTQPTPESDPCVPCVADFAGPGGSSDLVIDFSQSMPLPSGIHLDSVFLRDGTGFYPLALDPADIQAIEDGALAELVLPGWGPLVTIAGQPSLLHQLKSDPDGDCTVTGTCFWTSTPLLFKH